VHPIDELSLEHYYLFHAIRADLLRRLCHADQAEVAYRAAIERTDNAAEIALMNERISAITEPPHHRYSARAARR
jgi:RNA polymerase sigma-70 factor, ECF subfamily